MGLWGDVQIMYHMVTSRFAGADHGSRLEAFYSQQVGAYDDFRRRLLHGRATMMRQLTLPAGARLLDLGGGTGFNLEALGDSIRQLGQVTVLDLSPSMLKVADERIRRHGWTNVTTVAADATTYQPPDGLFDAVTFSYSLTMIPDWFRAIDHALTLLKPGGMVGVADFYIARKWPDAGCKAMPLFTRYFWPNWFSWDNVFLSPDHLPYLRNRCEQVFLHEGMGRVPYLLGFAAPYYVFVGRKRAN
jgi:S-adenosylmethionine-diacylgycerolhomoserine-N-methlytransferase